MTHRLLKNKFQHLQTPDASAEINNELSEDKGHNFAINDVTEALQSDVKKNPENTKYGQNTKSDIIIKFIPLTFPENHVQVKEK